ncbi:MAG: DUF4062 domain-containing protein [Phycisphaerales bacterium]
MIPNVFVSSTILDLHYLRDALRDAILDVSYNPVMSEHGGVGYIHDGSAAEACFVTIKQCQLAILLIGKKYGRLGTDGLSVTHKEFHAAREAEIPLITFVDADVMSFKKVFDTDPDSTTWDRFEHMDHPRETFKLLTEVVGSQVYNGLIEFRGAAEAKLRLKQQLAHFMGDKLISGGRPVRSEVSEILAEVKSLRHQISNSAEPAQPGNTSIPKASDPFYITLRFLLAERNRDYTKFVEAVFGDLDIAAHQVQFSRSLEDVVAKAGGKLEVVPDDFDFRALWTSSGSAPRLSAMTQGIGGSWAVCTDKHVYLSEPMKIRLSDQHAALQAKLR